MTEPEPDVIQGPALNCRPAKRPERVSLEGRHVRLESLSAERHAAQLYSGLSGPESEALWRYLARGPFENPSEFGRELEEMAAGSDPLFYAILPRSTARAAGFAALMRIEPGHQVIEVGNILYSPELQRTPAATEAMYLLARYVFEGLGYRRYEWKCNALNLPSRQAAVRLGFSFEGVFRQAAVIKGRNRDTAWYSIIDSEWPVLQRAFGAWLAPENFDADGVQRKSLSSVTAAPSNND